MKMVGAGATMTIATACGDRAAPHSRRFGKAIGAALCDVLCSPWAGCVVIDFAGIHLATAGRVESARLTASDRRA